MKKLFTYTIVMMFCLAPAFTAFADFTASMDEQVIYLYPVNALCPGPGIGDTTTNRGGISLSRNSFVRYSALGAQQISVPNIDDGQGMYVTSVSGKGTNEENLQFVVRANQMPGQDDDNNIYQYATSAIATTVPDAVTTLVDWKVRGTTHIITTWPPQ